MGNLKILLSFLLIGIVFAAGCVQRQESDDAMEKTGEMMEKPGESQMMQSEYSGTVLAGESAPLIDFNKADYDKVLQTDKLIVLYFYADWCPICRVELPHLYGAFNELTADDVIGFRVNYNDGSTDDNERNLARQFGVGYQHGKVFVRNGEQVLKSPESWTKERYLSEISSALVK